MTERYHVSLRKAWTREKGEPSQLDSILENSWQEPTVGAPGLATGSLTGPTWRLSLADPDRAQNPSAGRGLQPHPRSTLYTGARAASRPGNAAGEGTSPRLCGDRVPTRVPTPGPSGRHAL